MEILGGFNVNLCASKKVKDNNRDSFLAFSVFFQFIVLMSQVIIIEVSNISGVLLEILRIYCIIITSVPVILSIRFVLKRQFLLLITTYSISFIVFFVTYVVIPENRSVVISLSFYFFCICLPCFLIVSSIKRKEVLMKTLLYVSYAIFALGSLFAVLNIFGKMNVESYIMSFSYYLLYPACCFLYIGNKNKSIKLYILSLVTLLYMTAFGSRGASVIYVFYFIVVTLYSTLTLRRIINRISILSIFALIGGLFIVFYAKIIELFADFLTTFNINSRTLSLASEGELISHDSGRNDLYRRMWEAIIDRPLTGYGIGGDRVLGVTYAHNLFIEILLDFGFLFGFLILVMLFAFVVDAYRKDNNKLLFFIFLCNGVLPLMVSNSYLISANFWIFLGYCMHSKKEYYRIKRIKYLCFCKKMSIY